MNNKGKQPAEPLEFAAPLEVVGKYFSDPSSAVFALWTFRLHFSIYFSRLGPETGQRQNGSNLENRLGLRLGWVYLNWTQASVKPQVNKILF